MKVSDLNSGDLLYWPGTGWRGRLVRLWTRSDYGHVGMFWRNGSDPMLAEADPKKGLVIRPLLPNMDPPKWAQKTHTPWSQIVSYDFAASVGQPYSWWEAIRAGLGLPAGARGYMCSEFCVEILRHCGWWFPKGYNPSPAGLARDVTRAKDNVVEPLDF